MKNSSKCDADFIKPNNRSSWNKIIREIKHSCKKYDFWFWKILLEFLIRLWRNHFCWNKKNIRLQIKSWFSTFCQWKLFMENVNIINVNAHVKATKRKIIQIKDVIKTSTCFMGVVCLHTPTRYCRKTPFRMVSGTA